jgi:HNH endonuclease
VTSNYVPRNSWDLISSYVTYDAECVYCGERRDLVAHHKIPHSFGGTDAIANLEPVCRSCHPRAEQRAALRAMGQGRKQVSPTVRLPSQRRQGLAYFLSRRL